MLLSSFMLIPKEKPYLSGLNSYYLHIDKCVEHLQGEIGSGGLYCKSADQELFVFFDEQEIVRALTQKKGQLAQVSPNLDPVLRSLDQKSYQVTVYYLDANSIFFWGQMPPFKRAQKVLSSKDISLPDLVFRLRQKKFTGFIDVTLKEYEEGAILFYSKGERAGGSYGWGKGGLSPSNDDYNRLLGLLQTNYAEYRIGHFKNIKHEAAPLQEISPIERKRSKENEIFSGLDTAISGFLGLFVFVAWKKLKGEPLAHLKQQFHDAINEYPVLDPFKNYYEISDTGSFHFFDNAPREEVASAIVDITWQAVNALKLQKKFRAEIKTWTYKTVFEDMGLI